MGKDTQKIVVDVPSLDRMRERGGTWAAYRNEAMDSMNFGQVIFIRYGSGCTHEAPPKPHAPDGSYGLGWKYLFVGLMNTESGEIDREEHAV